MRKNKGEKLRLIGYVRKELSTRNRNIQERILRIMWITRKRYRYFACVCISMIILMGFHNIAYSMRLNFYIYRTGRESCTWGFNIVHHDGPSGYPSDEGYDIWDVPWADAPVCGWTNIGFRPTSSPYDIPLLTDWRPADSLTPVEINCDLVNLNEQPDYYESEVHLVFRFKDITNFEGKPILFQQKSISDDPNERYPVYDVRKTITSNGGTVLILNPDGTLTDLNGVYPHEYTFAKGVITFHRWLGDLNDDGRVNISDITLLADDWMKEGFALKGDLSGPNGIPDTKVNLYDLFALCEEWLNISPP